MSRAVSIVANKKNIPFAITEVEKDHAVLTPRKPLPRDTEIVVHVDGSLRSRTGSHRAAARDARRTPWPG
jgi:hypothetical protein